MAKRIAYIENWEEWCQSFSFSHTQPVQFSDLDASGHLNHTKALVFFETARIKFLQKIGVIDNRFINEYGTMVVAANIQCDYLRQVFFDEIITTYLKIHRIGTSSIDLHYMAKNENEEVCFVGRGVMVNIDRETGKARTWENVFLEKFKDYVG